MYGVPDGLGVIRDSLTQNETSSDRIYCTVAKLINVRQAYLKYPKMHCSRKINGHKFSMLLNFFDVISEFFRSFFDIFFSMYCLSILCFFLYFCFSVLCRSMFCHRPINFII